MKIIKFSSVPNADLYEVDVKTSKIYLNDIEIQLPLATIFLSYNLQGKYMKGFDVNGSLLLNIPLDITIDEVNIITSASSNKYINIKW